MLEAENHRSGSREWPDPAVLAGEGVPPFDAPDLRWSRRQHGIYVNYQHHTLPDGTALHVTVWSMANQGPEPTEVLAFPVSEGWVQRVGRL